MKKIKIFIILILMGFVSTFLFACKKKTRVVEATYTDPSISVREIYRSLREVPLTTSTESLSVEQIANRDSYLWYVPYEKISNYESLKAHFINDFLQVYYNDTLLAKTYIEEENTISLENIDPTFTKLTLDLSNLKTEVEDLISSIEKNEARLLNTIYNRKVTIPFKVYDSTYGEVTALSRSIEAYLFFVRENKLLESKQDPNSTWPSEILNYQIHLNKATVDEKSLYTTTYKILQEGKSNTPISFAILEGTPFEEYKYKFITIKDNDLLLDTQEEFKQAEADQRLSITPNEDFTSIRVVYQSKYGTTENPLRREETFHIKHNTAFTKPRLKYNSYFSILPGITSTALINVGTQTITTTLNNFATNVEFLDELNGLIYYDEEANKKTETPLHAKIKEQISTTEIIYNETFTEADVDKYKGSNFESVIKEKLEKGLKVPKIYHLENIEVKNRDTNNTEALTFDLYIMVNDEVAPTRVGKGNLYAKIGIAQDFIGDVEIRNQCMRFIDYVTKEEDIKYRFDLVLTETRKEEKKGDKTIVTYEPATVKENISYTDIPWHKNGEYKILVYAIDEANNMTSSNMFKIIISGKSDVMSIIILINAVFVLVAEIILIPIFITNKKRREKDEK